MEQDKLATDVLLSALEETASYDEFLTENKQHLGIDQLTVALRKMATKLNITPLQAIEAAQIERAYGYQIFNGTRKPSRDKLIKLAIGMKASIEDANQLLKAVQKLPLYAKSERDSIIIYGLSHKLDVDQLNDLLIENDQQTL